jgi:hypothetical protein
MSTDANFNGADWKRGEFNRNAPDIRLIGYPAFYKIRYPAGYRI